MLTGGAGIQNKVGKATLQLLGPSIFEGLLNFACQMRFAEGK